MVHVREDVQAILTALAAAPGQQLHEMDPAIGRQMSRQMLAMLERPVPDTVKIQELSIPGPAGAIAARLYQGSEAAMTTALLFFHGGGFVIGDLETHNSLAAEIAKLTGLPVIAVDYRLAPEHPFPAAVDDCLAAARWVAGSPAALSMTVERLVLAGDSAGGNLSAVCARALRSEMQIAAQWLMYPGLDLTAAGGSKDEFAEGYMLSAATIDWFQRQYVDSSELENPLASPLLSNDWEGLPPALVFTCGLDPIRDQGRAYAAKLALTGNRVIFREADGQVHGSAQFRQMLPSAQTDLEAQIADLKALLE